MRKKVHGIWEIFFIDTHFCSVWPKNTPICLRKLPGVCLLPSRWPWVGQEARGEPICRWAVCCTQRLITDSPCNIFAPVLFLWPAIGLLHHSGWYVGKWSSWLYGGSAGETCPHHHHLILNFQVPKTTELQDRSCIYHMESI